MYKVKNTKNGKFCTGSKNNTMKFSKEGKVYTDIKHVKAMLRQFYNEDGTKYRYSTTDYDLSDLTIIEYEYVPRVFYKATEVLIKK